MATALFVQLPWSAAAAVADVKVCLEEHATGKITGSAKVSDTVPDAEELLRTVGSYFGMDRDISIISCGMIEKVESWAASAPDMTQELSSVGVKPGRYIVYNPTWVREVIGNDRDQAIFVFGHEFGHFVRGHFFERREVARDRKELEADQFGGCATARMKSNWSSVQSLVSRLRPSRGDGFYPSAEDSVAVVKEGFEGCDGSVVRMCRVPDNGVASWGFQKTIDKASNWRGGGGNQPGYCAEAIAELKSSYPKAYEFEVVTSNETERDTCRPFRCIERKYYCTVNVKGDPTYLEASCK
ncbi:M48 family metalloprotease [Methylobacterium longum]|uniref:Peptidase M48 domain-containing protein n=1 Tax=Methylobacterium longum TaxID=767694 RepID=A0ABT8ANV5_9HYPH|nr:M48 family metalloprotease [Methylobacterium longum]MDN3571300.1 hypothetical protein [Methylobacterium longum]